MYIVTCTQIVYIMCTLQLDLIHCTCTAPCPTLACTVCVYVWHSTCTLNWLTTSTSTVNVHCAHGPTVVHILNGLVLVLLVGYNGLCCGIPDQCPLGLCHLQVGGPSAAVLLRTVQLQSVTVMVVLAQQQGNTLPRRTATEKPCRSRRDIYLSLSYKETLQGWSHVIIH